MRFHIFSLIATVAIAAPGAQQGQYDTATPDFNNLTVALVRAEPANWPLPIMNKNWAGVQFDLNATVAKGVQLIKEAADNGANLIVFPELWFPGYPKGMADNVTMAPWLPNYIANSLTVPSPQWSSLLEAAKTKKIYISPAFSHNDNGALYLAQALISPEGKAVLIRHKLRPSGGERGIWSDGTPQDLKVVATPYGRWGVLECWEHFHPAMTFNLQAQVENLHIAAWPYTPDAVDPTAAYWESLEINLAAARTYAVNTNAPLVFASVGNARFLDAQGLDLKVVSSDVSTVEQPLVYQSFNTTGLAATKPYAEDGEQSWGVLQEILDAFPGYIPKVVGDFVGRRTFGVEELLKLGRA